MKIIAFLAVLASIGACAADLSGPEYAARITTLSELESQFGKYPHPRSEFFQSACLLRELRRILGSDYKAFSEHLACSGAGMLEKEGDYACGHVSQLHVGGYDSLFYVNVKTEKMHLFWLKSSVLHKEYKICGDRPVPAAVLSSIKKHMNESWGHVTKFRFVGERLVVEDGKDEKPNPQGPANQSQPVRSDINQPSAAAGSGR